MVLATRDHGNGRLWPATDTAAYALRHPRKSLAEEKKSASNLWKKQIGLAANVPAPLSSHAGKSRPNAEEALPFQ